MHEVELGVWKGLMIHLIRILRSENEHLVHELDRRFVILSSLNLFLIHKTHALCRYRLVPTFGRDTIRRFRANTSDLKHMAARDFEDFLQVSMTSVSNCFFLM